ncbi:MAG: ABC transporter ATP-binding protein [Anaerolineae bacterium]
MLQVSRLRAGYGEINVLWDVDLHVEPGEVVALVGSNGAGKTTLLMTLAGLLKARQGSIVFLGEDITALSAPERVRRGLALVPEGRQLFQGLTVEENLKLGAYARRDGKEVRESLERVYALFPELAERRRQLAGTLSGGEQQMCAIGRGLMSAPKLLLIDELSLGLAPVVVDRLKGTIADIRKAEVTVLVVEQDVQTAFEISNRGYVLETGHIVREGPSEALLADPRIKEAYIGL